MTESSPTQPEPNRGRMLLIQAFTLIVVVVASVAAVYFRDRIQDLADYGYAAVFVIGLVSNATIILPVPGLAISSLMGGVFNPWLVGVVGGVGQALGELSGYLVGYSGHTLVDENPIYERLSGWMSRHGMLTVFVLAVIPNPIFDLGGVAAGALRMKVWRFLLSCAVGKVIKNVVVAFVGYVGVEAIYRMFGAP